MNSLIRTIGVVCLGMMIFSVTDDASAQNEKPGVRLTVYSKGYAVVKDRRMMDIPKGVGTVRFTDVASTIDATSVLFKSLTDPKASVLEQNYECDLVSAGKLLDKYIDRPIEVVTDKSVYKGKLLSFDGRQIVLDKDGDGIVMVQRADNVRDIRFSELPGGLLTRPTLLWLVATDKPGKQLVEVTYQTGGMGWHAEYVMVLGDKDATADLSGWVSVDNKSGKTYRDAKLKFIAGDVRRSRPRMSRPSSGRWATTRTSYMAPMEEKACFEYQMYTLPRTSTVADNETKQLEMFTPARGLKVAKRFLYNPLGELRWGRGGRYTDRSYGATTASKKVNVFIEFRNSKENKLGIPLPAGKVRVYKQDPADKALEFIGEEKIDHTPKDEDLSLRIGNAFDMVGERKQTNFLVESARHWMQEQIEIKIRNHKEQDVVVRIKEPLYRWVSWRITEKSHEFTKLDSRNIAFDVPVEKDGETVVTYTVDYNW